MFLKEIYAGFLDFETKKKSLPKRGIALHEKFRRQNEYSKKSGYQDISENIYFIKLKLCAVS